MAQPALTTVLDAVAGHETRRFQLPDLDRHARWFMPRFQQEFAHLNQRQAIGFLRSVVYDNECHFLYQEHGVALAQAIGSHTLDATQVIWERFVWVENPKDAAQLEAASWFYPAFVRWGQQKGFATMVVEEKTDVPHELIKARVGRVLNTEQKFVNVKA